MLYIYLLSVFTFPINQYFSLMLCYSDAHAAYDIAQAKQAGMPHCLLSPI